MLLSGALFKDIAKIDQAGVTHFKLWRKIEFIAWKDVLQISKGMTGNEIAVLSRGKVLNIPAINAQLSSDEMLSIFMRSHNQYKKTKV